MGNAALEGEVMERDTKRKEEKNNPRDNDLRRMDAFFVLQS